MSFSCSSNINIEFISSGDSKPLYNDLILLYCALKRLISMFISKTLTIKYAVEINNTEYDNNIISFVKIRALYGDKVLKTIKDKKKDKKTKLLFFNELVKFLTKLVDCKDLSIKNSDTLFFTSIYCLTFSFKYIS